MNVRPATMADVDGIAAVHRVSRADYYGSTPDENDGREAMWAHLMSEPGRLTYVAERSSRIEAFMSARRVADPDPVFELTAIYVHPARFGEGIGSRLYRVFDRERGQDEVAVLEVWTGNSRAVAFYEHRGWRRTRNTRPGPRDIPFVTFRSTTRTADTAPP